MFSASDVKKLREKTGAGMMNCKKALSECQGDFENAIDYLRKKGLAAAQKRQARVAAEGQIAIAVRDRTGALVEVNCETDFVAKGEDFQNFVQKVADTVLQQRPPDLGRLEELTRDDVNELTLKLGEKVAVRRFQVVEADRVLGHYNHGGRIGVLVNIASEASEGELGPLPKDLAMHVAAVDPRFVRAGDIDEAFKKREAGVYAAQLKESGKPEHMIDKIVEGKLRKLATEVCLLEQKFVKDPDLTVGQLLKNVGFETRVVNFSKFNLGEGIEKKADNLADEVAKISRQ